MTQTAQEAKALYPEMPLCIGYLSEGSEMTFATSVDSDYTSFGYLQEKFPRIIDSFKNGEWFINHGKTMSVGEVCYIKTWSCDSVLEIPLSEMDLFIKICGVQRKCKVCREEVNKLKRCAGCDAKGICVLYCSQECQRKDWKKGHKNECYYNVIKC